MTNFLYMYIKFHFRDFMSFFKSVYIFFKFIDFFKKILLLYFVFNVWLEATQQKTFSVNSDLQSNKSFKQRQGDVLK